MQPQDTDQDNLRNRISQPGAPGPNSGKPLVNESSPAAVNVPLPAELPASVVEEIAELVGGVAARIAKEALVRREREAAVAAADDRAASLLGVGQRVEELRSQGVLDPVAMVAREYGLAESVVAHWSREARLRMDARRKTERDRQVCRLWQSGTLTQQQIADRFRVSRRTVSSILSDNNLTAPPRRRKPSTSTPGRADPEGP